MRKEKVYTGYWNFHCDTPSVAGTLTVGSGINLNIADLDNRFYDERTIDCLRGIAIDDNNDTYYFFLYNLNKIASVNSCPGLKTYIFSVSYIVLSSQSHLHELSDNNLRVNSIIINNPYLNWWCRSLIKGQSYDISGDEVDYHYIHPDPILISQLDNCKIFAFISRSTGTPRHEGFHNKLESHFEIEFVDSLELNETFSVIHKIERLLSLLMCTPVVNDSVSFTIDEIGCICVQNITVNHYNYRQMSDNEVMFTSNIHDIEDNNVIRHWYDFYDEERQALNLFFDTIYNEELTDELKIICYSSVLEDLTKRYYTPNHPPRETRKRKMLQSIFDILKADGHLQEANNLKTSYLDKDDTFETRLFALLKKYQDAWEMLDVEEFSSKAVLTRNFLVHRQIDDNLKSYLYVPQEYEKLARTLRYIVSVTLLKELGVCTEDITRILCIMIGGIWTYEDYVRLHPETERKDSESKS